MASRDISGAILRVCFGSVRKGVTLSRLLEWTLEEIASAQRDLDVTGDIDSANYYAGRIDGLLQVAQWIAPVKKDKVDEFCALLDYTHETGEKFAVVDITKENAA